MTQYGRLVLKLSSWHLRLVTLIEVFPVSVSHWGNAGTLCTKLLHLETAHRDLRETGTVMPHARAGPGRRRVRDEEDVLDIVRDNPSTSTRHIPSARERRSEGEVWRTLRENKLYTFQVQPIQELQRGDKHLRLQSSRWVLHKIVDTTQFLCRVLWTDEAASTRSGVHSLQEVVCTVYTTCMYG
jgi:hypothetical protein